MPLNECPPRLETMLLKLPNCELHVRYVPGKQQIISDCLSRASLSSIVPESEPEDVIGINLIENLGFEVATLQKFKEVSGAEETPQVVMEYVFKGWQVNKDQVDELATEYWNYKEELSVENGLLFKSDRIVVPRAFIPEILDEIHGTHLVENKSLIKYVMHSDTSNLKRHYTHMTFQVYPGKLFRLIFLHMQVIYI